MKRQSMFMDRHKSMFNIMEMSKYWASQVALMVKNPPVIVDMGSMCGSGRCPGEKGMATHSRILT